LISHCCEMRVSAMNCKTRFSLRYQHLAQHLQHPLLCDSEISYHLRDMTLQKSYFSFWSIPEAFYADELHLRVSALEIFGLSNQKFCHVLTCMNSYSSSFGTFGMNMYRLDLSLFQSVPQSTWCPVFVGSSSEISESSRSMQFSDFVDKFSEDFCEGTKK
jgi:hypothetical protein